MEEQEIELIDYLNVIWKRKGLIIGGTLIAAAAALVVSLSMPKTYEVSRTLKIGQLASSGRPIETHEDVVQHLRDHRFLENAMAKLNLGETDGEIASRISIDKKINPHVRYIVQASDPQLATNIVGAVAEAIIKIHRPTFDRSMQITKEHEAKLAAMIRIVEVEIEGMKKVLKGVTEAPEVDAPAVILLQGNIEGRQRNLASLRAELKGSRLSRVGFENTTVIAADALPKHPIKPRVKLNVALGGTLGLMMFIFLAFFLEYLQNVRKGGRQK
ncbi:MAG: Wzz/FepE/Etk N-terminal domain-containing protein [Candidatus Binatia bacterium]